MAPDYITWRKKLYRAYATEEEKRAEREHFEAVLQRSPPEQIEQRERAVTKRRLKNGKGNVVRS